MQMSETKKLSLFILTLLAILAVVLLVLPVDAQQPPPPPQLSQEKLFQMFGEAQATIRLQGEYIGVLTTRISELDKQIVELRKDRP